MGILTQGPGIATSGRTSAAYFQRLALLCEMVYHLQTRTAEVLVSFKLLHFSPQASSRVIRMRAIPEQWSESAASESGFVRAWLDHEEITPRTETNWGAIYGLALCAVISAGFWTGIALLVERIWR